MCKSRREGGTDGPFPLRARVPRFPLAILRIVGRPKKPATSAYDAARISYCLRGAKALKIAR